MPIGIFDSGVGGLTVFSVLDKAYKNVDIFYLGDTARVPYGNKSKQTVVRYSLECASYLYERFNIDLLVVACNTASSYALETLRNYFDIPIIGVVEPGVEAALKITKNKKIGVIGTYATINSQSYKNEILKRDADIEVFQKPCPLFVPLVEEGMLSHPITDMVIREYLDELITHEIDTLILGCTHYPLLKNSIKRLYPDINIVDSSIAILEKLKNVSFRKEKGSRRIFVTDVSPAFKKIEELILKDIPLEKIELSDICKL